MRGATSRACATRGSPSATSATPATAGPRHCTRCATVSDVVVQGTARGRRLGRLPGHPAAHRRREPARPVVVRGLRHQAGARDARQHHPAAVRLQLTAGERPGPSARALPCRHAESDRAGAVVSRRRLRRLRAALSSPAAHEDSGISRDAARGALPGARRAVRATAAGTSAARQRRRDDDHLSFIAGASRLHRDELVAQGVPTLAAAAAMPLPIAFKPSRGSRRHVRARPRAGPRPVRAARVRSAPCGSCCPNPQSRIPRPGLRGRQWACPACRRRRPATSSSTSKPRASPARADASTSSASGRKGTLPVLVGDDDEAERAAFEAAVDVIMQAWDERPRHARLPLRALRDLGVQAARGPVRHAHRRARPPAARREASSTCTASRVRRFGPVSRATRSSSWSSTTASRATRKLAMRSLARHALGAGARSRCGWRRSRESLDRSPRTTPTTAGPPRRCATGSKAP